MSRSDKLIFRGIIACLLLLLGLLALVIYGCSSADEMETVKPCEQTQTNTIAAIRRIVQADKKACRLLDAWPSAPGAMYLAARLHGIDYRLLPAISRVEGPSPKMIECCNPYGLEIDGKLIRYHTFWESTEAAAGLLARMTGGITDVETLAARWCPYRRELWARNLTAIYNATH